MALRNNEDEPITDEVGTNKDWKQIAAAFSGNFLEWYDFSVYGYLSDVIGKVFFPQSDKTTRLALSFTVFGCAFFARPVGALLLARLGDKYGTKVPIAISILLMGTSSFGMGFLPSYEQVGYAAPVMLIILRICQGLSVGGQYVPTMLFSVENVEREKRGIRFALLSMCGNTGFLCGNLISALLRGTLSDEQLHNWGWRIPFWLGILVCISGIYLRNHIDDTEEPQDYDEKDHFRQIFQKENLKPTCCFIAVTALGSVTYYVAFTWMVVWMDHLLNPPVSNAYIINACSFFVSTFVFSPVGGLLVDRIQKNEIIMFISIPIIGAFFPLALLFIKMSKNGGVAFLVQLVFGLCLSFFGTASLNYFHTKFPPNIKVTAMSFSYNFALAIFGGMSPAVSTGLFKLNQIAPGFFGLATAIISMVGLGFAVNILQDYDEEETDSSSTLQLENENDLKDHVSDSLIKPLISQESLTTHNEIS